MKIRLHFAIMILPLISLPPAICQQRTTDIPSCILSCLNVYHISLSQMLPESSTRDLLALDSDSSIFDKMDSTKLEYFCSSIYKDLDSCLNICNNGTVKMFILKQLSVVANMCRYDQKSITEMFKCVRLQNETVKRLCNPKCENVKSKQLDNSDSTLQQIIAQLQYSSQKTDLVGFFDDNCQYFECLTFCELGIFKVRCGHSAYEMMKQMKSLSLKVTKELLIDGGFSDTWPQSCDHFVDNLSFSSSYQHNSIFSLTLISAIFPLLTNKF